MKFRTLLALVGILCSTIAHTQEICDNGIDDDADGLVDLNDTDNCSCLDFTGPIHATFEICNGPETDMLFLYTDFTEAESYQWYRDGIALNFETSWSYIPVFVNSGTYVLVITDGGECYASEPYVFDSGKVEVEIHETICEEGSIIIGTSIYTQVGQYLQEDFTADGCDSTTIIHIAVEECGDTIKNLTSQFLNNLILAGVDANSDGRIQFDEASQVDSLSIPYVDSLSSYQYQIQSVKGINHFSNLVYLDLSNHRITRMNIDSLKELRHVDVDPGILDPFFMEFQLATKLEHIAIDRAHLDLSYFPQLTFYKGGGRDTLDLSHNPELISISIDPIDLDAIIFGTKDDLEHFTMKSSEIATLDLSSAPNLETLNFNNERGNSEGRGLDISNNNKLKSFYLSSLREYPEIDLSHLSELENLTLFNVGLSEIDLSNNPKLRHLNVSRNRDLDDLDLSHNPDLVYVNTESTGWNLNTLDCSHNGQLDTLILGSLDTLLILNGSIESVIETFGRIDYYCADPEQYDQIKALDRFSIINTFCDFSEGATPIILRGRANLSADGINCEDSGLLAPIFKLHLDNGETNGFIHMEGATSYSTFISPGEITLTPQLENPDYFSISPESVTINTATQGSTHHQDFCVMATREVNDLSVKILPLDEVRPGFEARYEVIVENIGTTVQTGEVVVNYDADISSPDLQGQSEGELSWDLGELPPFGRQSFPLSFTYNTPMDTPGLNLGDTILMTATVLTPDTDAFPDNNHSALSQRVINSFDPNDKICLAGEHILPYEQAPLLIYRIRFENTGTADAINIVVKDFLDPEKFQINSLKPLTSSHDYELRVVGEEAQFIFSEINLPSADEMNDGYLFFEIKPQEELRLGDTISNTAGIYFDFNFPILTDPAETIISDDDDTGFGSPLSLHQAQIQAQVTENNFVLVSSKIDGHISTPYFLEWRKSLGDWMTISSISFSSGQDKQFSYLHHRPHLGWNFYRLSTEINNELRPVSAPASVLVSTSPEIILAPNPIGTSSGAVTILGIEHRATVTLIDNLGMTIFTQDLDDNHQFSIGNIPTGVYTCIIESGEIQYVKRLFVE